MAPTRGLVILLSLTVLTTFSLADDVTALCGTALALDCDVNYAPEGNETTCGSDNVTYLNWCFFAQAKCRSLHLTMLYFGPCRTSGSPSSNVTSATVATPTSAAPIMDEWEILKQFYCNKSTALVCADIHSPVCASDGKLYYNNCEFAKAKCQNESLAIQDIAVCPSAPIIGRRRRHVSKPFSKPRKRVLRLEDGIRGTVLVGLSRPTLGRREEARRRTKLSGLPRRRTRQEQSHAERLIIKSICRSLHRNCLFRPEGASCHPKHLLHRLMCHLRSSKKPMLAVRRASKKQ